LRFFDECAESDACPVLETKKRAGSHKRVLSDAQQAGQLEAATGKTGIQRGTIVRLVWLASVVALSLSGLCYKHLVSSIDFSDICDLV